MNQFPGNDQQNMFQCFQNMFNNMNQNNPNGMGFNQNMYQQFMNQQNMNMNMNQQNMNMNQQNMNMNMNPQNMNMNMNPQNMNNNNMNMNMNSLFQKFLQFLQMNGNNIPNMNACNNPNMNFCNNPNMNFCNNPNMNVCNIPNVIGFNNPNMGGSNNSLNMSNSSSSNNLNMNKNNNPNMNNSNTTNAISNHENNNNLNTGDSTGLKETLPRGDKLVKYENEYPDEDRENMKNIIFLASSGFRIAIVVPFYETISNIMKLFAKKIGIGENTLGKEIFFIFDATYLDKDDYRAVNEICQSQNVTITVIDSGNLLGA